MAAGATQADNAIARDQAQQAMARELRMQMLAARRPGMISADKNAPFSRVRHGARDAFAQAQKMQEALKHARNIRNIITLIGGLTSFTVLGIIWTFIQWNLQSIWTVFGLPGKDFFGMPWPMVGVTIFFDVVVIILLVVVVFIGYATVHPLETFCLMMKPLFGEHWYTSLIVKGLSLFGQCPAITLPTAP